MIPLRIALRGFLCYRDEQVLDFRDASLWMLAGPNGVGKSSVFDALTYSLFGQHRDGKQNAVELIHKESDGLAVEFDFALDGVTYRSRRTLKRRANGPPAVTQQLRRLRPDGEGSWEDVPDTSRQVEFDRWVKQHLGLSYETFTSSVVLMQGQAEKLIGANRSERFKVLAAIVDLDRFARLHDAAKARRDAAEARAEGLRRQLDALPEIADEALAEAADALATARAEADEADAAVARLQEQLGQARRWEELGEEAARLREWCAGAEALIADARSIEEAAARADALRNVLPALGAILDNRAALVASERASAALRVEHEALTDELRRREEELDRSEDESAALQAALAEDERRDRDLAPLLRASAEVVARLDARDRQRARWRQIEEALAAFPPDLDERIEDEEAALSRLAELDRARHPLRRLHDERDELRQAVARGRAAEVEHQSARTGLSHLEADRAERAGACEAQALHRQQAQERVAALAELAKLARDQLAELESVAGSPVCHACGQELTSAHYEDEHARRRVRVVEAERDARAAEHAASEAVRREKASQRLRKEAEARLETETRRVDDLRRAVEQAARDARGHARQCLTAYRELPEPSRRLVGPEPPDDWTATTYPTLSDLEAAQSALDDLPAARRRLQQLRKAVEERDRLGHQRDEARRGLDELERGLPDDCAAARAEHDRLVAEESALKTRLEERRGRAHAFPSALDRLRKRRDETRQALHDRVARQETERNRRDESAQAIARARTGLPDDWSETAETVIDADLRRWRDELRALDARDIGARLEQLRQARSRLDLQRGRLAEVEARRDEVPAEARRPAARVEGDLADAHAARTRRVQRQVEAARVEDQLQHGRAARQRLDDALRAADAAHRTAETLTRLLGRDFLQRHLLRQAERQIIDISNGILDRLSAGALRIELRPEVPGARRGDEALDLVAYSRAAGATPIGVAFLSGSQKFRVAVSLALGIGQYASKQHRPIQSVIIDEGFGCLDREGRQVMIQELQNLRGQLSRILLVSHQEEFVATFPDAYHFELREGATVATRVRR